MSLTWAGVLAHRLERQHLSVPADTGAEVVRRLGAVLAHDPVAAELAVGLRASSPMPGALAAAREAGDVVSVFTFRGAVHHTPVQEAGAWLALRAAGRQWERKAWREFYRLEPEDWPEFRQAVEAALTRGPLSPDELGEALAAHKAYRHLKSVFDDDPWTLLKALCWQGALQVGPTREGRPTLCRLADNPRWTGVWELDEAGRFAVRHYLDAYGPATPEHVHQWLGGGLSAGRRRIDGWLTEVADDVVSLEVEGTRVLALAGQEEALRAATPSDAVHLLPGHDQWVMGPGTKDERVVPPELRGAVTRRAGMVLVGGVVRGTWKRAGDEVVVDPAGGTTLPAEEIAQQVARIGVVTGRPATLR